MKVSLCLLGALWGVVAARASRILRDRPEIALRHDEAQYLLDEAEQESFCSLVSEIGCSSSCYVGCGVCGTECTPDGHISALFAIC